MSKSTSRVRHLGFNVDYRDTYSTTTSLGNQQENYFKHKKVVFDEAVFRDGEEETTLKGGIQSMMNFRDTRIRDSGFFRLGMRSDYIYFCDWFPRLFGIDENEIPSATEDEEGIFDVDWDDDEVFDFHNRNKIKLGFRMKKTTSGEDNLLYEKRPRQKPILERENKRKFECICDIDKNYMRRYIPHYTMGPQEGEELLTPHFKAFWDNFNEKPELKGLADFESVQEEQEEEEKGFSRTPAFPFSTKKAAQSFRKQILAKFRPLTCREIRRYRMPFVEALYLELQEDLYVETAEFFKHLLIKDHFVNQVPDKGSRYLRENNYMINKLIVFLKIAEKFYRRGEPYKEANILLRSGKYFNDRDSGWWWLAEELFTKAVKVSQKSSIDGGKMEAISNYILGRFLLDCVQKVKPAQEHLLKARELSLGKDWNAGTILNKKQDPLYIECANDLCRSLIAASKELRRSGKPEEALPLIHRSHKLCQEFESSRQDIKMETYFELGMTYQDVGLLNWAKIAFRKFIEYAREVDSPRSMCDGYLELAICFRSEGDLEKCYANLMNYLKTAQEKDDKNRIAFANRYIGEFFLNTGKPSLALEHFKKSFLSFFEQLEESSKIPYKEWKQEHFTLIQDVELLRVLQALALGEILKKAIFYLILRSRDDKNKMEIDLLIKWKNTNRDVSEELCGQILEHSLALDAQIRQRSTLVYALRDKQDYDDAGTESDTNTEMFVDDDLFADLDVFLPKKKRISLSVRMEALAAT